MAIKMTTEELDKRYKPGLNELTDGEKIYHFYQRYYYDDFKTLFSQKGSTNKTYEAIANSLNLGSEQIYTEKTVRRYQEALLFGKFNVSKNMGKKFVAMLFAIQENDVFKKKHTYIMEYQKHVPNESYQWDDRSAKWKDIIEYSDAKKNNFITGYIMEIINQMSISDFYSRKADWTFTDKGFYDDQIEEIYKMISELYLTDDIKRQKWNGIMDQIGDMVHRGDFPGIYDQTWIEANEAITYFDVAYDIAAGDPALFKKINEGKTAFRFSVKVTKDMLERRKRYKEKIERDEKFSNAHKTDVMLLEKEMRTALTNIYKKMNN